MNSLPQILFSWQLVIFGLTIAGIMHIIHSIVEYFITPSNAKFCETVFIPSMHIILGGVIGYFVSSFPYPDQLINCWDRVIFGIVAGLLSDPLYKFIQYVLSPKVSVVVQIINAIGDLRGKKNQNNKDDIK